MKYPTKPKTTMKNARSLLSLVTCSTALTATAPWQHMPRKKLYGLKRLSSPPRSGPFRPMRSTRILITVLMTILTSSALFAGGSDTYRKELFVAGSPFHGIHGIVAGPEGELFVASVLGQSIYRVDPENGTVATAVGPPEGVADDLIFGDDGTMYWTAFLLGKIFKKSPGGTVQLIAEGLPGINSIGFHPDGRLFATQVFLADALHEIDVKGDRPPRLVMSGMGGLNGFEFTPDGFLYGPLYFKGQVVRINVDNGSVEVIADGFKKPASVKFGSDGTLYLAENAPSAVWAINITDHTSRRVARLPSNLDSVTVAKNGAIYGVLTSDNAIRRIDPKTGAVSDVVKGGELALPGGLAAHGGHVYVADSYAFRRVLTGNGTVEDIERDSRKHEHPFMVAAVGDTIVTSSWYTGSVLVYDAKSLEMLHSFQDFAAPYGIAAAADGTLLIAEYGTSCIVSLDLRSGDRACVVEGLAGPTGLALSADGILYISEEQAGQIVSIELATGMRRVFKDGLNGPEGIAIDGDQLLIAETGNNRVISVGLKDRKVQVVGEVPMGLPAVAGWSAAYIPSGVTVSGGDIYVSSDIENSIYRFTTVSDRKSSKGMQ